MYITNKYAIYIEKKNEGWTYKVQNLHGEVIQEGLGPDVSCANELVRNIVKDSNIKCETIRTLSKESRKLMLEIFERGGRLILEPLIEINK